MATARDPLSRDLEKRRSSALALIHSTRQAQERIRQAVRHSRLLIEHAHRAIEDSQRLLQMHRKHQRM